MHAVPWAVRYDYGSNAYVDEFEKGKLPKPPPPALTATSESGRVVPLQPQVVEKDPDLRQLAAKQHSEWLHRQVYSTITAWIIAALLVAYFTMPHVPGRVFALMLIIEARRGSCWRCSAASRRSSGRRATRRT